MTTTQHSKAFDSDYLFLIDYARSRLVRAGISHLNSLDPADLVSEAFLQTEAFLEYNKEKFMKMIRSLSSDRQRGKMVNSDNLEYIYQSRSVKRRLTVNDQKRCSICKLDHPLALFYLNPNTYNYCSWCPACKRIYSKNYGRKQRERLGDLYVKKLLRYSKSKYKASFLKEHPAFVIRKKLDVMDYRVRRIEKPLKAKENY